MRTISSFLASSAGILILLRNVANYLSSSIGRSSSVATVSRYVKALKDAYLFYPIHAMNVSGKQLLKNAVKYHVVDPGSGNYLVPRQNYDLGFLLENIVYLELCRRGYEVYIGKMKDLEVDFIAQKSVLCQYFQITANCSAKETFEREIEPLQKIKDNYKKTILTLDNFTLGNYGGISVENAISWLLE